MSLSILLVEDDKFAQLIVKNLLQKFDTEVTVASTGEAALFELSKQKFDFVFMDLGLPDIDGTEVVARFRKTEGKDPAFRTKIVALSAQGLSEAKDSAVAAGMDGYIEKPLTKEKLLSILDEVNLSIEQKPSLKM